MPNKVDKKNILQGIDAWKKRFSMFAQELAKIEADAETLSDEITSDWDIILERMHQAFQRYEFDQFLPLLENVSKHVDSVTKSRLNRN